MTDTPANHIFHIKDYGLIKVAGLDASRLLQGQVSCDVNKITSEAGSLAVHCNPQGRIISLFYLFQADDTFIMALPEDMAQITIKSLKKYAAFYKAQLTDATGEYSIIGSDKAGSVTGNYSRVPFPTNSERSLYLTKPGTLPDRSAEWKRLNILSGIPAVYPDTSEKFLPHELNLPALGAVDFNKGCYTGQEIIARMHYRAKLKKHMYLVMASSQLMPGEEIKPESGAQNSIATVIDSSSLARNDLYPVLILANEEDIKSGLVTQYGLMIEPQQSEMK